MDFTIYIIINILALVQSIPTNSCQRLKIGDHWYERQIIWANLGRAYTLHVHKTTNTLFFSYSLPETYSEADFQLAYLEMNSGFHQSIPGIRGGCSVAINQELDEVYLGGSDGIYKYNMMTKIADFYKEKGKNIWYLFYNRNLFYISYPNQKLYIEIDGRFSIVKEFENFEVDVFYVTNNNEIYFANKTGFYKFDNIYMKVDVINEMLTVRQIVEDNEEKIYICTNMGVYVDAKLEGFKKILDMKNIYGVAFDKDNNLIYADDRSIVKLKYSKTGCEVKNTW